MNTATTAHPCRTDLGDEMSHDTAAERMARYAGSDAVGASKLRVSPPTITDAESRAWYEGYKKALKRLREGNEEGELD